MSNAVNELTDLTRNALKPRVLLNSLMEYSLLGGIVTAMAIGVMRLQ